MICIPLHLKDGKHYDVVIVLDPEGIKRIQERDPAEFLPKHLGPRYEKLRLRNVMITYHTPDEEQKIQMLASQDRIPELLKFLTRGFRFRPQDGDHDNLYQGLLEVN